MEIMKICDNVVTFPASKRMAALARDTDALIDVFQELHEIEQMTGRAGLSARVRLSIMNILTSADKLAEELL